MIEYLIIKNITKIVNIQLDSLLVNWKLCSIDGSTGPMIPVSNEPINTPIRNNMSIKFRVFVSSVFCIVFFLSIYSFIVSFIS